MTQQQLVLHDHIVRAMTRNEWCVNDWCETHGIHYERDVTFWDPEELVMALVERCATQVLSARPNVVLQPLDRLAIALDRASAKNRKRGSWLWLSLTGRIRFRDVDVDDVIVAVRTEIDR